MLSIVGMTLTFAGLMAGALGAAWIGIMASGTAFISMYLYGDACTAVGAAVGIITAISSVLGALEFASVAEVIGISTLESIQLSAYWSGFKNLVGCLK